MFAPQALIDHAALRHNLQRVREAAPDSRIWAVIKADAYGHGVERVTRALADTDGFAVARIEEAARLRRLGVVKPILVLGGCYSVDETKLAAEAGFEITLHQLQQVELLDELTPGTPPLKIWLLSLIHI